MIIGTREQHLEASRPSILKCSLLYSMLRHKLKPEEATAIITEALDVERKFIREALPVKLIGMNAEAMEQYLVGTLFAASHRLPCVGRCQLGSQTRALQRVGSNDPARSQEFVADRLLLALGCEKHFNTANPFDWMELISLQGKTNFFEKRVGDYQKSGVMQSLTGGMHLFDLNAEF